jgi:UDP:flavonoid glycosyltransferase YjiC (YdhE family)
MKITILTYGSRGDVQPLLPLSARLMEAGHAVKLAAPFRFKSLADLIIHTFTHTAGAHTLAREKDTPIPILCAWSPGVLPLGRLAIRCPCEGLRFLSARVTFSATRAADFVSGARRAAGLHYVWR